MRGDDEVRQVVAGGTAGVVATVAMSAVLAVAARLGLLREPPPRAIVRTALPGLSREAVDAAALVAHIGYGAAAGAVHRAVLGGPGPAASVLYGLGLWAGSYEGWVPLLGALPPAHLDDRRRQASMIAGHVVYGAVLGAVTARRRRAPRREAGRLAGADAAGRATRGGDRRPQDDGSRAVESSE
ncbi:MAG TPA: DUF6789 family protein [Amnibacterium sp.]|jgi:hypothetical protein|nr:DUF6789 family protein [Amnibacterium sp.]